MLVTGIVMAPVGCWPNPLGLAMSSLAMSLLRVRMSGAVRSSTESNRTLGELHHRERDKGPEEEANAQRPPTDAPPLTPHAAHPTTATGAPRMRRPSEHNSHSIVTTGD